MFTAFLVRLGRVRNIACVYLELLDLISSHFLMPKIRKRFFIKAHNMVQLPLMVPFIPPPVCTFSSHHQLLRLVIECRRPCCQGNYVERNRRNPHLHAVASATSAPAINHDDVPSSQNSREMIKQARLSPREEKGFRVWP